MDPQQFTDNPADRAREYLNKKKRLREEADQLLKKAEMKNDNFQYKPAAIYTLIALGKIALENQWK